MDRLELKARITTDEAGTITGLAWPFGSPDQVGDLIEKGAFKFPSKLPMLFAHDQAQAIGVWDSIEETPEGLTVKGRLFVNDVSRAREVRALVKEEAVTGLSIGFVTRKSTPRRDGGRTITALDLHEISVVPVPMHPGARVTSAKAADVTEITETPNLKGKTVENEDDKKPDFTEVEAKMNARMDKIEAKLNRPVAANDNEPKPAPEMKSFISFVRKGVERLTPDEMKSMTVANDNAAGYLAPPEFSSEIIKLLRQYSPIRQYAKVTSISTPEIKLPRRTGSTTAYWVAETDDRTSTQMSYEQIGFTPFELAAYSDISNALLEDNAYNLEGELADDLAESFGIKEGTAFVTGDGSGKPNGLLATGAIANEIKTGAASTMPTTNPADKLIDLYHFLPNAHAQNAVWLMNRNTLATVRKWKDGNNNYLVVNPITASAPLTLLGRPIVEVVDMPDIAANTSPIIFGDLQGYRIVDRISLGILRDPFTLATKGQVRFHARKRVTADITHPDRFVRLKVAA